MVNFKMIHQGSDSLTILSVLALSNLLSKLCSGRSGTSWILRKLEMSAYMYGQPHGRLAEVQTPKCCNLVSHSVTAPLPVL